jgi:hypothetical protein
MSGSANHYIGLWNASTNSPTVTSSTAPSTTSPDGAYYIVSVAGNTAVNGNAVWNAGDMIMWNAANSVWNKFQGGLLPEAATGVTIVTSTQSSPAWTPLWSWEFSSGTWPEGSIRSPR